jgi:hypothetical protein
MNAKRTMALDEFAFEAIALATMARSAHWSPPSRKP